MDENLYYRRRLRLSVLLFRLHYYMQTPEDIAAGIYRYGPDTYVHVMGETVRLVKGAHEETMGLEDAIARCKAALDGVPPGKARALM